MAMLQVKNLTTTALLEGQRYYVTVVAWNGAGPPLSSNFSSEAVLVDITGPVAGTWSTRKHASTAAHRRRRCGGQQQHGRGVFVQPT